MKCLAPALLLSAVLSLSDACYTMYIPPDQTHCQDGVDYTWHAVGSKWRNSNCMDCTCGGCCSGYGTPTDFPDDCVAVFDPEACQFFVHKKNDTSVLCPVYALMRA